MARCEPPGAHPLWIKWDREERLKVDNDLRQIQDPNQLPPDVREAFEAERDAITGKLLPLKELAMAADEHWSARIPEHSGRRSRHSFTGL